MLETVGQYRILEWLRAAELGELCRARDMRLGRTVALTLLAPDLSADPARLAAFTAAAQAAAAVSHPHIAALYEVGAEHDPAFLAHEFVSGDPLPRLIAGHPLNIRRAVGFAVQIADALAEAHARGVEHGDLSAAHVVVTPKGSAKLVNVGLAAWHKDGRVADRPGDLVALGGLLFEMTTGKPVGVGTAGAWAPSTFNRLVPPALDRVVATLLGRDPGSAYTSAALVAADLRAVAEELEAASTTPARSASSSPPAKASASTRWIWIVAALVLVATAIWVVAVRVF